MKKSDAEKIISNFLKDSGMDADISNYFSENILKRLLAAGFLPPRVKLQPLGIEDNAFDPETKIGDL